MKKITLFNLIFRYFPGEHIRIPFYLPYGCLCLISVLRENGYEVDFRDYQFNDYTDPVKIEHILEFLDNPADIIAISCLSKELPYAVFLCYELKKKYPHKKIILGGNGPSGVAGRLMKEFPFIDFVVTGEGEFTLTELLSAMEGHGDYGEVNGMVYRKDGLVLVTPERERIRDLDSLPLPAYDCVNMEDYEEIYISCSRGCPFRCTFCSQSYFWKGKMIYRGFEKIFQELDLVLKYKPHCTISLSDNIFGYKKEDLRKFYEEYRRRNYTFKVNMARRLDDVDDEVLSMAKEMNCQAILYGVESGSIPVLKKIKKNYKADAKEVILKTADRVETFASFIFNYPFETIHDFLDTMNFIYDLLHIPTAYHLAIHLHYLAPIPETEILEEYPENLIYREFANVLTTGRAMENYDYWRFTETNKTLVMPPLVEVRTHPDEIRNLVLEYRDIFPSYYIYDSPHMEEKEKFLKCLYKGRYSNIRDYFFCHNGYKVFMGSKRFYIVSPEADERDNALYIKLREDNLDSLKEILEKNKDKKIFIDHDFEEFHLPEVTTKISGLFRKIKEEKIDSTLMNPLPAGTKEDRWQEFNIEDCKNCPSMFSVHDETLIYCGGLRGKYFPHYKSREHIYEEFLAKKTEVPGSRGCCLYL